MKGNFHQSSRMQAQLLGRYRWALSPREELESQAWYHTVGTRACLARPGRPNWNQEFLWSALPLGKIRDIKGGVILQ